jgi:hypothetical protein
MVIPKKRWDMDEWMVSEHGVQWQNGNFHEECGASAMELGVP